MDERHQRTILLVDNDVEIAEVVSDILSLFHLRVVTCLNSERAQQWIADLRPDLVILDVEMPGLDGITLFTRLRAAAVEVPVIFFTANPSHVTSRLVDYKARGAALIAKPRVDLLPQTVLQTLAPDRAA